MKAAIIIAATLLTAAAAADDAPQAESERGLAAGLYYRVSFPAAGEDANASWGGGGVRFRADWSDAVALAAAFGYDRHEFPASESILEIYNPGEGLERQLLFFRGGAAHDFPLAPVYPYAGGGFTLAREKTYFRDSRLKPQVLYHPGLYAEAGTDWPLVGPLTLDVGPELAILFGKRVAAYDAASNKYRYDDGAALYVGVRAGVGIHF
jgi:hypothetical protein